MTSEHPKFQDDVRQFSGKINEQFVEWVTDLRHWEAEHKDETKPRVGSRLHRRGLLGDPKHIIKTLLGQGDLANFAVRTTSRRSEKCYGDTFEEQDQQALDNHFDMRQGRAEAFQAHINREEMMSLSVQNSTKIALDEKMRGYWLIRTSAFSEQEITGIRIVTEGSTGLSAVKRAIQQTIVSRQRERKFTMTVVDGETEPVTRQAVLVISFTPSPTVRNPSQRQIWESLDEQDLWYATDDKAEFEAMIGLREARKELQHATTSRRFWLQLARTCDIEQIKIHPRIEEVTTCNRWRDERPPKGHRWR